jgi:hypothetical protein
MFVSQRTIIRTKDPLPACGHVLPKGEGISRPLAFSALVATLRFKLFPLSIQHFALLIFLRVLCVAVFWFFPLRTYPKTPRESVEFVSIASVLTVLG